MSKLEKLEALAQASSPGPWVCIGTPLAGEPAMYQWTVATNSQAICRIRNTVSGRPLTKEDAANAEFIAAVNPKMILELIGLINGARSVLVSQEDRLIYENPEESSVGVRFCCGVASFRPHLPSCDMQGFLEKLRKFDEGDL